jgi:Trk K+ transport system NAD-binding subunit
LTGEFAECEVIDDEQIRTDKAAQLAIEGVVGARARQSFQKKVGFDEEDAVIGATSRVTESLS